ncbi:uncharacterized protein ARMOST_19789 [Armillaria ostoyae]|uniref:CxC2-like cysteine cluster KDZ transposase-associated domain-containing protein n=1 Tax=Armillaria ostoyae TaxID=47428 RepID=A0A284S5J2_ARMOS|nr:uncharacterized protein ARMOST_19789 [Armillaria ostoyae]
MPLIEVVNGKRRRLGWGPPIAINRDRVELDYNFEVIYSHEIAVSAGGRTYETPRSPQKGRTTWTVRESWLPEDDTEMDLDENGEGFHQELMGEMSESRVFKQAAANPLKVKNAKKSQVSRRPHVVWKEKYASEYLDELLRHEGRGDSRHMLGCPDCVARASPSVNEAEIPCRDCFLGDLVCKSCCRRRHRQNPLHSIERWNGTFFERISLKDIGLHVQLNHHSMCCKLPVLCHQDFEVLHTNGIHQVAVDYCGCERQIPHHIQLLRCGWYPASQLRPRMCASMRLLEFFHLLSLCSKLSVYDFYRTLEKLTSNTGMGVPKSCIKALMRMMLQWRFLKLLKRGGRGHVTDGIAGTKPGELAVLCPSCPRPGINLPEGWEKVLVEMKYASVCEDAIITNGYDCRFLYVVILCMDANFRLKNQLVSSFSEGYEKYVLNNTTDKDISTCVGFAALAKADTKFSRGLRYTGVGAVSCGRGEFVITVGNLHKGERYAPMDHIFGSSLLTFTNILAAIISYDIACQWFVNLYKRMNSWPESIKPSDNLTLTPAIPKFHEPAHEEEGHEQFSCNLLPGMGASDLEVPERIWGPHNAVANSTKTMGPRSRMDVIDDHFGFWNWTKYASMGTTLARKYKAAIKERNVQVEGHRGFTEGIPKHLVEEWSLMCKA